MVSLVWSLQWLFFPLDICSAFNGNLKSELGVCVCSVSICSSADISVEAKKKAKKQNKKTHVCVLLPVSIWYVL